MFTKAKDFYQLSKALVLLLITMLWFIVIIIIRLNLHLVV